MSDHDLQHSAQAAPQAGAALCALDEIANPGTAAVNVSGFPVLVVRTGDTAKAFVNACPHQHLPLDYRSASVLSEDGRLLRCSNHQAGFDAASGAGVDGLGLGCALDPVPVVVDDAGIVRIGIEPVRR